MDIFSALNGISPWWWVALALALITLEMLTFSFFLIWPALGAMTVAVALWIAPDLSGAVQIMGFAVLSVVLTLVGRAVFIDRRPSSEVPGLNDRAHRLVGRSAVVIDGFASGGMGNVEVDGVRWRARLDDSAAMPAPGESRPVRGADGMTLILGDPG